MTVYVGYWTRRSGPWHLVESEIADRVVLKCGREMRMANRGQLVFALDPGQGYCRQCAPEART